MRNLIILAALAVALLTATTLWIDEGEVVTLIREQPEVQLDRVVAWFRNNGDSVPVRRQPRSPLPPAEPGDHMIGLSP